MVDVDIAEVSAFLADTAPFAVLPRRDLDRLSTRLTIRYARRGTALMTVGRGNDEVFVVRSGAIQITDDSGELVARGGEGTAFGTTTLDGQPSRFDVEAIEDTLLLVMPAGVFHEVAAAHAPVADFFSDQRQTRLRHAVQSAEHADRHHTVLQTRLGDLVSRAPITVGEATTIREAARLMTREQVSSLLVVDGERLVGLLTDRDLRSRVVAAGRDPSEPVRAVMTVDPVTAGPEKLAIELVLDMTSRNVHHMPVIGDDRLIGMITSTDIMRLERANPVHLVGDIAKAPDLDTLVALSRRLPRILDALVDGDATPDATGRILTTVGDAIERRILHLTEARLGASPAAYAWVALGSQARFERTMSSDQDNALVIGDDASDADLAWFEALARDVVAGLEACGYPRCAGDVMATNPLWRQRLRDWRHTFTRWIREPEPDAVLGSAIFFDMRIVHGDAHLVDELRAPVLEQTPGSHRFLAHLARNAAAAEPPLGFFRGFVLERHGEHRDTLDLKRGGIRPVVDVARVGALSHGLPQIGTLARIAALVDNAGMSASTAADLRDAFEFLRRVRLSHQAAQLRAGQAPDNFVAPDDLSGFDRRHLRDAFQIIRSAQQTALQGLPLGHLT